MLNISLDCNLINGSKKISLIDVGVRVGIFLLRLDVLVIQFSFFIVEEAANLLHIDDSIDLFSGQLAKAVLFARQNYFLIHFEFVPVLRYELALSSLLYWRVFILKCDGIDSNSISLISLANTLMRFFHLFSHKILVFLSMLYQPINQKQVKLYLSKISALTKNRCQNNKFFIFQFQTSKAAFIIDLMNSKKLKWKTDFDKEVVIENFIRRGWNKADKDEEEWNFYWATVWTVRNLFNPKSGIRLNDHQVINHFPNHYQLTRKDLMVKNLKRYKKQMQKNEHYLGKEQGYNGPSGNMDFFPMTFTFPNEYAIFLDEFQKNPNATWIVKPNNKSQGYGIFLLKKINQLKKIVPGANLNAAFKGLNMNETYVISRYIDNPLLIGGKKFDLRLYVLVTNYRPIRAYIYDQGFGRFCNQLYSSDIAQMDNMFVHLTNVAIQKYSEKYSGDHGGKWSTKSLKFYLEMVYGTQKASRCFQDINNLIIMSLKSVQTVIINDKHCFELYGFDVLIDDNCKPWLIEINASPSLTTTTQKDKQLKMDVLRSIYEIVIPEDWGDEAGKCGTNTCTSNRVGGFSILYDQTQDNLNRKNIMTSKRNTNKIWR